jgi:hypothetical protein
VSEYLRDDELNVFFRRSENVSSLSHPFEQLVVNLLEFNPHFIRSQNIPRFCPFVKRVPESGKNVDGIPAPPRLNQRTGIQAKLH